jgi:phenylpropionate dioxygenase-like ring-hydroxylating dioxygenase large terminal subunit
MAAIDHWHPVLRSRELRTKPRVVRLCGHEVVLFRADGGRVGALADRCPHRGMRLSKGWVAQGRLVCPYHGWNFDDCGEGRSPGTPKLRPSARRFQAAERHGFIWVKAEGAEAAIPDIDFPGYYPFYTFRRRFKVPQLLLLDNFTEMEHTATAHFAFGYPLQDMPDIQMRTEVTDHTVRVVTDGPQKAIPWIGAPFFGAATSDPFTCDWTTYFSPVHTIYEIAWQARSGGSPRRLRLKYVYFFIPLSETETELVGRQSSTMRPWGALGLNALLRLILAGLVRYEFELDRRLVEDLADMSTSLRGAQLGRFDKALVEQRKRLASLYEGVPRGTQEADGYGLARAGGIADPSAAADDSLRDRVDTPQETRPMTP